jgi:hypothetical protein
MEQIWLFERLAVTLARIDFVDPELVGEPDVRERGVRLEIRPVETSYDGSVYASPSRSLRPGLCRIDLLESAPHAADRMHWHPAMDAGEPGDRTFDVTMVDDPLRWLDEHLRDAAVLLRGSSEPADEAARRDLAAIADAAPAIVAAAEQGLAWARVDPWPDVEHDERGLAAVGRPGPTG